MRSRFALGQKVGWRAGAGPGGRGIIGTVMVLQAGRAQAGRGQELAPEDVFSSWQKLGASDDPFEGNTRANAD